MNTFQYPPIAEPMVPTVGAEQPAEYSTFPALIARRSRLHPSAHPAFFFDRFDAPTVVAAPDLVPVTPQILVRRGWNPALYQLPPEWGVQIDVPVMSWTGRYPDTLPAWRREAHPARMQALSWDTVLFPGVVVPPDQAVATYPDRVHRPAKLRHYPQPAWPPFTADATVTAPALSWDPLYQDRIAPLRGLRAHLQQAFAMWPSPVPVVAVSDVTGPHRFRVPAHSRRFRVPGHARRFRT